MPATESTSTSLQSSTGTSNRSLELEGPRPKYCIDPEDEAELEDVERYEPGGFHPLILDEFLCNGRFEVTHKLGQGGFATIWLCRDHQEDRWCALKIIVSSQSSEDGGDLKIMKHLREKGVDRQAAAAHHVVVPEEHFWIDGPNGRHLALVTPLLGPSLSCWLDDYKTTIETMTSFCRQMVKGLQFLHDNGICHGDFRPANILLKIGNIDHMTATEVCELLGGPDGTLVGLTSGEESSPHAPEYLVTPGWWGDAIEKGIVLEEIAIVDFGEAFLEGHPPKFSGIPRANGAPEVMYNQTPSAASDVWALGTSIMHVFGGSFFTGGMLLGTKYLEASLGPLPVEYRADFEKQHRAYLAAQREHEDMCERNLLKQGLREYVDKRPKTEPSEWVLTEAQRTDPSHPVSYPSVSELEAANRKTLEAGHSHRFSHKLASLNIGHFKGPNPRNDNRGYWYLTPDEVLLFTDLALKIFRYDGRDRPTAAQILQHPCFKEEDVDYEVEGLDSEEEGGDAQVVEEEDFFMGMGYLQRAINALWPRPWWFFQTFIV